MAKQAGFITFVGRIGNVLSYYLNKKLISRTIGKVDVEKMRSAPQYEETRKNQSEFALATKAGQLFRQGLMHLTKGYTNYEYPIAVMKILLQTLRSDAMLPKGKKQITNGLKNAESQLAFNRLHIFSKRETEFYRNDLLKHTPDQSKWRLNRKLLFGKGVAGDQMTVKIGYLNIDFERRITHYEEALSIACHRNEKIDCSDFALPKPNETNTPWTFVIMQVWREGSIQEVTGMTYMSVIDVVENGVANTVAKEENEQKLHRCGREIADGKVGRGLHKVYEINAADSNENQDIHISHGYSLHRENTGKDVQVLMVPLKLHGDSGHDWEDVIKKLVNKK